MKRIAIRACAYKVDNLVSKEICRWPPIDKHQDMIELFSQVSVGRESNIKEKLLFRVVENQFQRNVQKYNFFGIINDQQSR